ncbi:MAG: hypothetical protein ACRDD7_12900, partial [Peptostreptococcaceae bacterium]
MIKKIVKGKILNNYGEPIHNCKVELYLKKLRNDQLLITTCTDICGKYEIEYSIDENQNILNQCETDNTIPVANIFIKAYICNSTLSESGFDMFCQNQQCSDFIQSDVVYNASDEQTIDIIEGESIIEYPKYDKLTLDIRKLIYDMKIVDLVVDTDHNDIEYVSNLLNISQQEVLFIILSHRIEANYTLLTQRSIISLEGYVFYAFLESNQ